MNLNSIDALAANVIRNKLSFAVLSNIEEICTYFGQDSKDYHIPKDLEEVKNNILVHFKNIDKVLELNLEHRKEFIDNLESDINFIENFAKEPFSKLSYCDLLTSIISDYYQLKTIHSGNEKNTFNSDLILKDISDFIDYAGNQLNESYGVLLSILPFSMTRENYSDYISKSFEYLFNGFEKGMAKKYLESFKIKFCPLPFIKDTKDFEIFNNIDFEKQEEATLLEYLEKLEEIGKDLIDTLGDIDVIYGCLKQILAVYNFCLDKEYLFNQDLVLKDMFYSLTRESDFNFIKENILNTCLDKIDSLAEKIDQEEEILRKAVKNKSYEKLQDSVKMVVILDEYFKPSLERNAMLKINSSEIKEQEKVQTEDIENMANEFINYVNTLNFNFKVLKKFKQQFFFYIPFIFTPNFLKQYVNNVFANLSPEMQILTAYKLQTFINPNVHEHDHSHEHCTHEECTHHH